MTLTLTLTPEKQSRLQEIADRAGLSLTELAQRALDDLVETASAPGTGQALLVAPGQTLADRPQGRTSTVEGPADLSENTDPTLALFTQWAAEDATDDPTEIARREREDAETTSQLRKHRFSLEGRTDFRRLAERDEDKEQDTDEAA